MIHTLQNEQFQVKIGSYGAELHSFFDKSSSTEFIWTGDPAVWSCHAPILFPVVGRLRNSKIIIDGSEYHMDIHGFIRTKEFDCVHVGSSSVEWQFDANAETKAQYPFDFSLKVSYQLKGSLLEIRYTVCNIGDKPLPFSIGSHTAFLCPQNGGETIDDYEFVFEKSEHPSFVHASEGLITGEETPYKEGQAVTKLTFDDIQCPTGIILNDIASRRIALHNKKTNRSVWMHTGGSPTTVFWKNQTPPVRFVCIEPWFGLPDALTSDYQFSHKKGLQTLAPHSEFTCNHSIEID